MAQTVKDTKRKFKDSFCFIFAVIPVLNCIPFFHMNSKVQNKKWKTIAWVLILLQIALIIGLFLVEGLRGPEIPSYLKVESYVNATDYMNNEQRVKYSQDSSFTSSSEWKNSDEYAEYLKAVDERTKRESEWKKQPEIAAQYENRDNFRNIKNGILTGLLIALFIIWLFSIILAFTERPRYLKLLKQEENKNNITDRIRSVTKNIIEPTDNKEQNAQSDAVKQIDINSADEEAIASLPGLTIIDAKKAISYRNEHNGFNTADEFFASINAKPHIIAQLESKLIIGNYKSEKPHNTDNPGKRTIDI